MTDGVSQWVDAVVAATPPPPEGRRLIVAIGGPPASGKSTLAAALVDHWGSVCSVLPLDGFHFDDVVLDARGHRARKGAPHTFDAVGFGVLLEAVRTRPSVELGVPRFDRSLELSRAAAAVIGPEQRIVVVEGNYLHVDIEPWSSIADLYDVTVDLQVEELELRRRILDRWREHGFSEAEAQRRWDGNDGPNARWVAEHSRKTLVTLATGQTG